MIYLDLSDLLAAAEEALQHPAEVRDYGLLESAIARPQTTVLGVDAYPDLFAKAAALLHSLACNHALVDGNKRTALVATLLFLELNGVRVPPTDDAYDLMVDVASGAIRDVAEISTRLSGWAKS